MSERLVPTDTGVKWHVAPAHGLVVPSDTMTRAVAVPARRLSTPGSRLTEAIEDARHSGRLPEEPLGTLAREVNRLAGSRMAGGYIGRLMRSERGQRIAPEVAFAMADVLGVEPRWLWLGQGEKHAQTRTK